MIEPTNASPAADEAPFTADAMLSVPSPAANDQILIELVDDKGQAHPAELVALFGFEEHEYALIVPLDQEQSEPSNNADEVQLQVLIMRATEDGYVAIEDQDEFARVVAELERQAEEEADQEAAAADAAERTPAV